jgi:hypothetical protein
MHILEVADRRHGSIPVNGRDLALDVGKSLKATMSYIDEMEAKQVCVYRPALNQHRAGELEISDAFWPYVKEEATSRQSDLQSFIFDIKDFLRMRLCVICRFVSVDLSFAEKLYIQGVRTEQFRRAVILGCCRKYISLINGSEGELIAHLSYFSDAVDEASDPALFSMQWEIKEQLELYKLGRSSSRFNRRTPWHFP